MTFGAIRLSSLGPLRAGAESGWPEAGDIAARPVQRGDQARADRIDDVDEHHRHAAARRQQRFRGSRSPATMTSGASSTRSAAERRTRRSSSPDQRDVDPQIAALVPALGFEPLGQRIEMRRPPPGRAGSRSSARRCGARAPAATARPAPARGGGAAAVGVGAVRGASGGECCALARKRPASGTAAAPPRSEMNSRRRI